MRTKNVIDNSLKSLYGKPCWGLRYDCNTNLDLSFGDPVLKIYEPRQSNSKSRKVRERFTRRLVTVKGKWWLWVFIAKWEISFNGKRAATNKSPYRKIPMALAKLSGQIVASVEIDSQTGETKFEFDLGGVLRVRRWKRKRECKDDLWMLYKPNGYVLTVRGDGRYSHKRGDARADITFPIPPQ